ncbi:hypothetical protein RHMOL_Rhmol08G0245700 [Rhododendron molle]|uniref:Uncharacterized protein n=1 Tax=Rhododendron molle TaxID=49168 RepID=A0ACC0MRZ2_RHOML|nr:hypothetical protein RHMOL_Rhmol08G0245700 [Rhododendron molle]
MSTPMEISLQNPATGCDISEHNGGNASEQNGAVTEAAVPSPIFSEDKFLVSVEVCLKPSSTARIEYVRLSVERMLENRSLSYVDGPVPVPLDDSFLVENVQRICICDTDEWVENHDILLFWQVKPVVHVFQNGGSLLTCLKENYSMPN